jgi:uncharacterized protein
MNKNKSMIYLFILIAIITLAIIFWAHYFLFSSLIKFLGINNYFYLNILKAIFIILPFSFIAASVIINRFSNIFTRLYYVISATWLGVLLYFTLACLLIYFILYLTKLFSFNLDPKPLALIFFITAIWVIGYGLYSAQNLRIKKIEIALTNLPEYWQGKTAVFISDLHLGVIENYEFAERLAKKIESLKPNLLFIGGDFYDGQKNIDLDRLAGYFSSLNIPEGKFFITGNHEEFGDNTKFINAIKDADIKFLNNEMVNIKGLQIIGVDYKSAYEKNNFSTILENLKIDKKQPSILLRHVPDKISIAVEHGISLMLSGHAHRGQLFPIQFIEHFLYHGFQYGLKKMDSTFVYTSSGAGTWGPPMRVLADPEIVQIFFN